MHTFFSELFLVFIKINQELGLYGNLMKNLIGEAGCEDAERGKSLIENTVTNLQIK